MLDNFLWRCIADEWDRQDDEIDEIVKYCINNLWREDWLDYIYSLDITQYQLEEIIKELNI